MDNATLDPLLNDARKRQYWLKPIGHPKDSPEWDAIETRMWTEHQIEIHFAKSPAKIAVGAIVIAYRIHIGKLLYVAERLPMTEWEREEKRSAYSRQRWPYYIKSRNLAPEYAAIWKQFSFEPFPLAEEYNETHASAPVRLNGIKRGHDKAEIPRGFAEYLIRLIRDAK